jgi:hypothetical protein
MDQDLDSDLRKPPTLCNIVEELRCHILSFLSYTEIIRCMLVSLYLSLICKYARAAN